MKKFLNINDRVFVSVDKIESIGLTRDGQLCVVTPYPSEESDLFTKYEIKDGRTLSDIMAEIEGEAEEKVCKWTRSKDEPDSISAPHLDKRDGEWYYCCYEGWLKENPYCAICGGRIEVQDE